ncbi:MAG: hypothetical protein H0V92_13240 [Pseudonocardiales bacterium]|nr:hypothetical protein [Pseudonocardiales bacterium]
MAVESPAEAAEGDYTLDPAPEVATPDSVAELVGKGTQNLRTPEPDLRTPEVSSGDVGSNHITEGSVDPVADSITELIASGAGRRRLSTELGITEHQARQLLANNRNGVSR